jgi:hypothetical protein
MITISGRAFASRVCGSLVRAAGLPELVCASEDEYVGLAVALAGDPARLAGLKARLEKTRLTCDLFNTDKLAHALEGLYRQMVADYQAGRLPQPDLGNLEAYLAVGLEFDHEAAELMAEPSYHELYLAGLERRHLVRPLRPDPRLWPEPAPSARSAAEPLKPRTRRARA